MEFVELHRQFAPVSADQEPNLELGPEWGPKIEGWLGWQGLLEHRRVILLAEATSGKTKEFDHQVEILSKAGKAAFFLRIEELADGDFETALDPNAYQIFESWYNGNDAGWFFLDSIDEARLNQKNFDRALRQLARALNPSLPRASILISCRVSDWKGDEDKSAIERRLPAFEAPRTAPESDETQALLAPIFDSNVTQTRLPAQETKSKPAELLVVRLIPLSAEQQRALAMASGLQQAGDFIHAIRQHGLEALAERPGDLLDLAEYWKTHGCFSTLVEMTEYGIAQKLSEWDQYRPDNTVLSPHKARAGAERLAAALTLGKSFTLRTPGQEPDPKLEANALNPTHILEDWSEAERNALIRLGAFVPATYGRVRFHHRSTQEYLTAKMFADENLADAMREAWGINDRWEFRITLLQLIEEGAIEACADLARRVLCDQGASDSLKIAALRAVHRCDNREGLEESARQLTANPAQASARLAAFFATHLYPCFLSTDDLLTVIAESQPAAQETFDGFSRSIGELYAACPDDDARDRFLSGLTSLCLAPPFKDRYQRVSARHLELAKRLTSIAHRAIQELGAQAPPDHLVRLLMAVERAGWEDEASALITAVQANAGLNQALFWANVEEAREYAKLQGKTIQNSPHLFGRSLLWLSPAALSWLWEDLSVRASVCDRQVALSALVLLLHRSDRLDVELPRLRGLVADSLPLREELDRRCLALRKQDEDMRQADQETKRIVRRQRREKREPQARDSWVAFQQKLQGNPSELSRPQ